MHRFSQKATLRHNMVFSSIPFLYFFLPAVLAVYFAVPWKFKNVALLVFSLLFYLWGEPKYTVLMLFTITFCYGAGLLIEKRQSTRWSKVLLIFSVAVPIGLLALFKYADFIIGTVGALTNTDMPLLKLALPIGISFYTFQALSYVVDVYRGEVEAQKSWIDLACYVTLFPQLIAGPIVRYSTVAEELKSRHTHLSDFAEGARRFVMGLGKKVLIANILGEFCAVYRESQDVSVLFTWLYAVAFALQIYFDFSAYSDMAIGIGRIFGFHFLENFNYPFISKSITEFWRRWHMSLGSWFRDYLYIPLGGNRVKVPRQIFNIAVVWALTGLWHGAGWSFVLWGLYFAVLLVAEKFLLKGILEKMPSAVNHIYLLFTVLISFVIFNGESFVMIKSDLSNMFGTSGLPLISSETLYYLKSYAIIFVIALIGATPLPKKLSQKAESIRGNTLIQCVAVAVILTVSTAYLVDGSFNPFLYFRF